jgi:hypothetical protein
MRKKLFLWMLFLMILAGIAYAAPRTFQQQSGVWYAPDKDPQATLDYTIDWAQWLAGDTIQTSSWIVQTGITLSASSNTTTTTTVWLSLGTAGQTYKVTNMITTTAGRTTEQSFNVRVNWQ